MKPLSRRSFLASSALAVGAGLASRSKVWAQPAGANEAVRVGIIGLGNKGRGHLRDLLQRSDVRVTALCDVDPRNLAKAGEAFKDGRLPPVATTEARKVLDRPDVDAVVIATGNQWHALLTVWACQAGKDVYVEKPVAHTVWEGRKMIEAVRKYGRIVQVGTQRRSDPGIAEGIAWLQSGQLGKIRHVHCVYFNRRPSIGRRLPWYPDWLDYDLFCGPAPLTPLERNALHYDWHWSWATGNGDLGNNGVHLLDMALRVVPAEAPLRRVFGLGGRFVVDDTAETPNAQMAVYDFSGLSVIFEHRALSAKPGVEFMDNVAGRRVGMIVYCEGGHLAALAGGMAYDSGGTVIRKFEGDGGAAHMGNFLDAVRSRRTQDLAAPVEIGHAGASLCHFGNISYRLGVPSSPETIERELAPFPAAQEIARGLQTHLGLHGVDFARQPLLAGPWLEVDTAADDITSTGISDESTHAYARFLLRETQRPPYAIPEQV